MTIIGRADKADFPELNLRNISLKVDTGAYTSSIHCHDIEEVVVDGFKQIKFKLLDPSHKKYNDKIYKTKNYKVKSIKSSNGNSEDRFIVKTEIVLFDKTIPIELSLSERSEMKYPVLLGRKFLSKKFIVNTSLINMSYKLKKENKSKLKLT